MLTLKFHLRHHKPSFSVIKHIVKEFQISSELCNKSQPHLEKSLKTDSKHLNNLIKKYSDKIIYSTVVESTKVKLGYVNNKKLETRIENFRNAARKTLQTIEPLPVSLGYFSDECNSTAENVENNKASNANKYTIKENIPTQFPFESTTPVVRSNDEQLPERNLQNENKSSSIHREIEERNKIIKNINTWMTNYDNYEYDLVESKDEPSIYGTPDPKSLISNTACGGCGALLHCKDTGIPGYIPSEIFKNYTKKGAADLSAVICQRCHFLKEYNVALQVQVSPEDYEQVLTVIREKRALVVLMVDLLDFPCSIWPGLSEILGPRIPLVVVGNKIDLLPKDGDHFLKNIKQVLINNVQLNGFATANIKDVCLISARTGYGIENLITTLQSVWKHKGDVYLVGCTNVGKSSLFNALLQSDFCKIQAADLIQRATTSLWPGTTLNLLKFPMARISGYRAYLRHQRLVKQKAIESLESKQRSQSLNKINKPENATLIGHIGRSYAMNKEPEVEPKDSFSVSGNANASGKYRMGIDEKHPDFALSKWCFDTPGVVQPDQILHILTTEELVKVLPKEIIRPESYCIKPDTTLFIGGLGRLDFLEGGRSIRVTVFKSDQLPITVCKLQDADYLYKELLGTEILQVPVGTEERLLKWPGLEMGKSFKLTGKGWKHSSADIVLSNAGWIAINCSPDSEYVFQAWTPEKRGIYLRECLLPKAVTLRGRRIKKSVAYVRHRLI